ncbi:alpha/beta hydrolase [Streptomyces sp. NPDC057743]|uniref:alpha/beta hydrolase n=1 Tax=Streptomyces sp. NPDC057743 TaxID=3346236 RepID=UPI0036C3FBD1
MPTHAYLSSSRDKPKPAAVQRPGPASVRSGPGAKSATASWGTLASQIPEAKPPVEDFIALHERNRSTLEDDLLLAIGDEPRAKNARYLEEALESDRQREDSSDGGESTFADLRKTLAKTQANIEAGPVRILTYDSTSFGRMAVAIGDIEAATHVGVLVPGMGSGPSNFGDLITRARNVYRACREVASKSPEKKKVAIIAWQGYKAPDLSETLREALWDAGETAAMEGSRLLLDDLADWRSRWRKSTDRKEAGLPEQPKITVVGHSYGSVLVGHAFQKLSESGGTNSAPVGGGEVDYLVFTGSPGTGVKKAEHSNIPLKHQYVLADRDDPVTNLNWYTDPAHQDYDPTGEVTRLLAGPPAASDAPDISDPHSGYYVPRSISIYNIARVVTEETKMISKDKARTGYYPFIAKALNLSASLADTLPSAQRVGTHSAGFPVLAGQPDKPLCLKLNEGASGKFSVVNDIKFFTPEFMDIAPDGEKIYLKPPGQLWPESLSRGSVLILDNFGNEIGLRIKEISKIFGNSNTRICPAKNWKGRKPEFIIVAPIFRDSKEMVRQWQESEEGNIGIDVQMPYGPLEHFPTTTRGKRSRRSTPGETVMLPAQETGICHSGFPKLAGDDENPSLTLESGGLGKFSVANGARFFTPEFMEIVTDGKKVELKPTGLDRFYGLNKQEVIVFKHYGDGSIEGRFEDIKQSKNTSILTGSDEPPSFFSVAVIPDRWHAPFRINSPLTIAPSLAEVLSELLKSFPTATTDFEDLKNALRQSEAEFTIDFSAASAKQTIDEVRKHIPRIGSGDFRSSFDRNLNRRLQDVMKRIFAKSTGPARDLAGLWLGGQLNELAVTLNFALVPGMVAITSDGHTLLVSIPTGEHRLWNSNEAESTYKNFVSKHLSRSAKKYAEPERTTPNPSTWLGLPMGAGLQNQYFQLEFKPFYNPHRDLLAHAQDRVNSDFRGIPQTYTFDDYTNALFAGQDLMMFGDARSYKGQRFKSGEIYLVDVDPSGIKVERRVGSGNVFALNDPACSFLHLPWGGDFEKTPFGGKVKCPRPLSAFGDRLPILALFGGRKLIDVIRMDSEWHSITFDAKSLIENGQSIFGAIVTNRSKGSLLPSLLPAEMIKGDILEPYSVDIKLDENDEQAITKKWYDELEPELPKLRPRRHEPGDHDAQAGEQQQVPSGDFWRGLARSADPQIQLFQSLAVPEGKEPVARAMLEAIQAAAEQSRLTAASSRVLDASLKYQGSVDRMRVFHYYDHPDKYLNGQIPSVADVAADLMGTSDGGWTVNSRKAWRKGKEDFLRAQSEYDEAFTALKGMTSQGGSRGTSIDDIAVQKNPSKVYSWAFTLLYAGNLAMSVFGGGIEKGDALVHSVAAASSIAVAMSAIDSFLTSIGKEAGTVRATVLPAVSLIANTLSLWKTLREDEVDAWAVAFDVMGISADVLALLAVLFPALSTAATVLGALLAIPSVMYMIYNLGETPPLPDRFVQELGRKLADGITSSLEDYRADLHQKLMSLGVPERRIAGLWNSTERSSVLEPLIHKMKEQNTSRPIEKFRAWDVGPVKAQLEEVLESPGYFNYTPLECFIDLYDELKKYCIKKIQDAKPGALNKLSFSLEDWLLQTKEGLTWARGAYRSRPPVNWNGPVG